MLVVHQLEVTTSTSGRSAARCTGRRALDFGHQMRNQGRRFGRCVRASVWRVLEPNVVGALHSTTCARCIADIRSRSLSREGDIGSLNGALSEVRRSRNTPVRFCRGERQREHRAHGYDARCLHCSTQGLVSVDCQMSG